MRVLVTGGAGFVGSHAARALVGAGCDVHVKVRPGTPLWRIADLDGRVRVVESDVSSLASDRRVMSRVAPEACLHLAWYTAPRDYTWAVRENMSCLRSGIDLLETLVEAGCRRVVIAGTCAEYDAARPPLTEHTPTLPATPYARAKHALHLAAREVAAASSVSLCWARLFYLYGPAEHPERVVPAAIGSLLRGEAFPATAGEQVRDYLHVGDAAEALACLVTSELDGAVNVCSGVPVTLKSVLSTIEELMGAQGAVRSGEIPYGPGEPSRVWGSNERLRGLGWRPRFALRQGLADAVDWWRRRLRQDFGAHEQSGRVPRHVGSR